MFEIGKSIYSIAISYLWYQKLGFWHYSDVTWVSRRFKSTVIELYVQQLIQTNNKKKNQSSVLLDLCDRWSPKWLGKWKALYIPVKLPWIFPGTPSTFNWAPWNTRSNRGRTCIYMSSAKSFLSKFIPCLPYRPLSRPPVPRLWMPFWRSERKRAQVTKPTLKPIVSWWKGVNLSFSSVTVLSKRLSNFKAFGKTKTLVLKSNLIILMISEVWQ